MQFDNKDFESRVKDTMTTLDKFKSKLNFKDSAKSLEDLGKASEKVNFNVMATGLDNVKIKFSAMQTVAFTALQNITNSAMSTGKKLENMLTIGPIKTGFSEYETQINSIQTILTNTKRYGTTLEEVNTALDKLNEYSDQTIYNFAQMTKAIGMFTTAGIDLDTSVAAVKGISNLAAYVGAPATDASRAMYQLSQALSLGYVRLTDWMSLENTAGMAGKEFQDRLITTARVFGTGVDSAIEKNGNFRESLKEGWLTTEVLNSTLAQFAGTVDRATLAKQGFNKTQIDSIMELGEDATKAATKIKTFTQLVDTLKETLGSGWAKTWRLIIGDFDEARNLWTSIADAINPVLDKAADARNALVAKVMGNPYADLIKSLSGLSVTTDGLVTSTNKYKEIVNSVIRGNYGNGQPRFDKLSKDGYNWAKVQNLVNKELGNSYRYNEDLNKSEKELNNTQAKTLEQLLKLSDAKLIQNGLTKDEVKALRELEEQSKKTGIPIQEIIDDASKLSGRSLIIGSFENIGKSLVNIFGAVKKSWDSTFDPISAISIYDVLAKIHKITSDILIFTETRGIDIQRTVSGLVALLDILHKTVRGGITFGIKALNAVLGAFGLDILGATATIGDFLVKLNELYDKVDPVTKGFTYVGESIKWAVEQIKEFYDTIMQIPEVQEKLQQIKEVLPNLDDLALNVKEGNFTEIGEQIINGLKKGLETGYNLIPEWMRILGNLLIDSLKDVLGIHSPSWKAYEIMCDFIQGGINAVKDKFKQLNRLTNALFEDLIRNIESGNVDWGKVFSVGGATLVTGGFALMVKKVLNLLEPIKSLDGVLTGTGDILKGAGSIVKGIAEGVPDMVKNINLVIKGFYKVNKAKAFKTRCEGLRDVFIGLAILAASVALLARQDETQLKNGIKAIITISAIVAVFTALMNKIETQMSTIDLNGGTIKFNGINRTIKVLAKSLLVMAAALKMLAGMTEEEMERAFPALLGLFGMLAGMMYACSKIVKNDTGRNLDKLGTMVSKLTRSMILMIVVVKLASRLSADEMGKAAGFATGFAIFVGALCKLTKNSSGEVAQVGKFVKSVTFAMGLMVGVVKLVGYLNVDEMKKGAGFAVAFLLFVKGLVIATKGYSGPIKRLGRFLTSMSLSMLILAGVVKLVGRLSIDEMKKGAMFAAAFLVFVKILIKITKGYQSKIKHLGRLLLSISIAMALMAGVVKLVGYLSEDEMKKGAGFAAAFLLFIKGLVKVTTIGSGNKTAKLAATLFSVVICVGVLAAIAALVGSLDTMTLIKGVGSVAILCGALSFMMKSLNGTTNFKDSLKTLGVMALALLEVSAVLFVLNRLNVDASLETAGSLSLLLIAMSAAALILGKIGPVANAAALGAAKLLAVVGIAALILAGIGGLIGQIDGAEEFLNKGIPILEKIGQAFGSFFGGIVAGFRDAASKGFVSVGENMVSFVNKFAGVDPNAATGASNFGDVMLKLTGAGLLDSIARLLGFKGLAGFGKQCKKFGESIADLCDALNGVTLDGSQVQKAIAIGDLLRKFQDTLDPAPGAILKLFTFSKDLGDFGKDCKSYGRSIKSLVQSLEGVDLSSGQVQKTIDIGTLMSNFKDGLEPAPGAIRKLFSVTKNLGDFGNECDRYVQAIIRLNDSLDGVTIDNTKVEQAAKAGELLSGLKAGLVEDPGPFIKMFVGIKDLGSFGSQCKDFAAAMKDASDSFAGLEIDLDGVQSAVDAGILLNGFKDNLGDTPGILASLFVDLPPDIGKFGEQCKAFAKALKAASNALTDEDGNPVVNTNSVKVATDAGTMLAKLQEAIPEKEWFSGKVDLDTFGSNIKSFGEGMGGFSDEVKDLAPGPMRTAIDIANSLKDLAQSIENTETFGNQISAFSAISSVGGAFASYSDSSTKTDFPSIIKSISVGYSLARFISSLKDFDGTGVESFKTAVDSLGNIEMEQVQNTLNYKSDEFAATGKTLMEVFSGGLEDTKGTAVNAVNKVVSAMKDKIKSYNSIFTAHGVELVKAIANGISSRGYLVHNAAYAVSSQGASGISYSYNNFYNNGINLGMGLVRGINAMRSSVYWNAYYLGREAVRGERDGQQSHSPSKATEQSGIWLGEGLINGIIKIRDKVKRASEDMGKGASKAINDSVSIVRNLMDDSFDTAPTISPVVDLTNVRESANTINALLNDSSLIPRQNLVAISSNEPKRNQNGNSDIINAIDSLGKNLSNRGDTYNIDGITYSNGTEIEEAVKVLVRAANMERRR